jgi:hypothetical protein
MENLKIRCKTCGNEMEGKTGKTVACGCPNMAIIHNNENITALDLSKVIMINYMSIKEKTSVFTSEDLAFQEARRRRKVRRLDFDIR